MDQLLADPAWIHAAVGHLFDLFGAGGLALAWRAGARVTKFETAAIAQDKINADVEQRLKAREAAEATMREKIAALPTRDEITRMFGDLREDIRDLKPRG